MALKLANNATSRLAVAISASDTTVIVQAGDGAKFPSLSAGDWFPITLLRADNTHEIMRVTARTGDVLTVQRGQEGTAPITFSLFDKAELRATVGVFAEIVSTLSAAIGARGPRIGDIKQWHGAIADIVTTHGPGWQLADGTNGTADLRDRFIVAAGRAYAPGATGGSDTVALTTAQMPAHTHANTITDPGHTHANTLTDPGHIHSANVRLGVSTSPGTYPYGGSADNNTWVSNTGAATTGVKINNVAATSGVTIVNVAQGGGEAHENRPPYYALAFIEYTGIGAAGLPSL